MQRASQVGASSHAATKIFTDFILRDTFYYIFFGDFRTLDVSAHSRCLLAIVSHHAHYRCFFYFWPKEFKDAILRPSFAHVFTVLQITDGESASGDGGLDSNFHPPKSIESGLSFLAPIVLPFASTVDVLSVRM